MRRLYARDYLKSIYDLIAAKLGAPLADTPDEQEQEQEQPAATDKVP